MTRVVMTFPFALSTPGGGTQDATELALAMAELGAELVLVTPDCDGPGRFPRRAAQTNAEGTERAERLRAAGVELLTSPAHPLHFRLDGRGLARAVDRALDERPARAVLGYWHEAFFLPDVARRHGARFAMTGTASFSQFFGPGRGGLERLRNARLARTYRAAEVVFTRSRFTCAELQRYLDLDPSRLRVVPLGVEQRFFDLPRSGSAGAGAPILDLVFVGRLVDSKGIFDALDALGRVVAANAEDGGGVVPPAPRLRVIGWGDRQPVLDAAARLGLSDRVELLGGLGRDELARELGRAELALLPTHTESFGLAVAEAQAAGLCVVGFAAGAVPEVVEDGVTGRLVPAGDRGLLAEALGAALADPEGTRQAGLAGRRRAAERYRWRVAAERTLAGLEESSHPQEASL